jgi:hypothetical protein
MTEGRAMRTAIRFVLTCLLGLSVIALVGITVHT